MWGVGLSGCVCTRGSTGDKQGHLSGTAAVHCRYNSSARHCQPGHQSITHTHIGMPQQNKLLLTTVEIWYNAVGTLSVSFKVNRKSRTEGTFTALLFGFNLEECHEWINKC